MMLDTQFLLTANLQRQSFGHALREHEYSGYVFLLHLNVFPPFLESWFFYFPPQYLWKEYLGSPASVDSTEVYAPDSNRARLTTLLQNTVSTGHLGNTASALHFQLMNMDKSLVHQDKSQDH